MHKTFHHIIRTLKKARGSAVQLIALTGPEKTETAPKSSEEAEKGRRSGRSRKPQASVKNPAEIILADFEKYGLIEFKHGKVYPKFPFMVEARLSVAPNGLGFGMGNFDKDIIIPPSRRNGANHRDKVLIEIVDFSRDRYEGRVASVIEPFTTRFLAKVRESQDVSNHIIALSDLPDSPLGLLKSTGDFKAGDYVIVTDTGETREIAIARDNKYHGNKYQRPYYQECGVYSLFKKLDESSVTSDHLRVAARFNIPTSFDEKQVPKKRDIKKLEKTGMKDKRRVNLKKLYACTIDGADSKDFDDAISFEQKGDISILYVHIADVSHFVPPDSLLDIEAYKRGNSYYLRHAVFPMLPPILSEEFCSLKPKSKRLSFTCEMRYDKNAELIDYKLYKSIIHLGKRFTYDEAEKHLENPKSPLYNVWQLAKKLHARRVEMGKIELNIREMEMKMDAHGRILAINEKAKLLSHRLVEECMLSANTCTAHYMTKHKLPGLYRVHEPMPPGGLDKINAFFKLYGIRTQLKSLHFQQVQKAIETVKGTNVEEVFNYILLRSFSAAVYKSSPLGHWGLGFSDYTHFTSPIRRYSDLVVHRVLDAHIHGEKLPYNKGQLDTIGTEVSRLERIAMDAEKTMTRLISLRYFNKKVGQVFDGFLSGFNPNGLYIQLADPRVEGVVPATSVSNRGEIQIVDDFRVRIGKFSKVASLGQKMRVKLVQTDWEKIQLVLEIVSLEKEAFKSPGNEGAGENSRHPVKTSQSGQSENKNQRNPGSRRGYRGRRNRN